MKKAPDFFLLIKGRKISGTCWGFEPLSVLHRGCQALRPGCPARAAPAAGCAWPVLSFWSDGGIGPVPPLRTRALRAGWGRAGSIRQAQASKASQSTLG